MQQSFRTRITAVHSFAMAVLLIGVPIFFTLILLTLLRFRSVTPYFNTSRPPPARTTKTHPHVLILLGSGGHTSEMLSLFSALPQTSRYKRTYVFSSGDSFSAVKAAAFEAQLQHKAGVTKKNIASPNSTYTLLEIPRARRVGQSWLTTPLSCIVCIIGCLRVFTTGGMPDVVVCNGPGSAVMMVAVCFLYKFFGLCATRTIYIESFARVKSLSLSGKLLYPVVDRFIVQWPGLKEKWARAEYHGILI